MNVEAKIRAAGISVHNHEADGTLHLHHNGAYRKYSNVLDDKALDAAIAEFHANTPAEWYK